MVFNTNTHTSTCTTPLSTIHSSMWCDRGWVVIFSEILSFYSIMRERYLEICELRLKLNFLTIQILFMYFMFGFSNHCIFSKHFTRARKFSTHIERETHLDRAHIVKIFNQRLFTRPIFETICMHSKLNIFYPFAYSLLRFIYYFQPSFVVVRMWICLGVYLFDRDLLVLLVPLVFIYLMLLSRFDEATKLLLNIKPSGIYRYIWWAATSHLVIVLTFGLFSYMHTTKTK